MSDLIPFLSPRLVGDRFSGHAIPLEMLKDLAVLEEMIHEVAKWKFLEEHSDRQRTPRGFTDGISLKLTSIDDGSAIPCIALCLASLTLFPPANQTYFVQARDSIVAAVDAAEHGESITKYLPESQLSYFDRIGRSLRDGETIEFNPADAERPARLNKVTRRKLLFASSQVQDLTEEVTLRGTIPEADQVKMTFEIQEVNGAKVTAPFATQHRNTVLEAFNGYLAGTRVLLKGIGRFNRNDRLQKIESVEHISILDPNDIAARLEEFRCLRDGWLEEKGIAPNKEGLVWLTNIFETYYPDDLPLPFLYPTAEGGVQSEWSLAEHELSLEVNFSSHRGEWHSLNMQDHQDETFRDLNLDDANDWQWMIDQIARLLGGAR
jgi:hypothetical protein